MIILYELTQALFLQTPLAIELDVFFYILFIVIVIIEHVSYLNGNLLDESAFLLELHFYYVITAELVHVNYFSGGNYPLKLCNSLQAGRVK